LSGKSVAGVLDMKKLRVPDPFDFALILLDFAFSALRHDHRAALRPEAKEAKSDQETFWVEKV
jgi:hypothetical protein